MSDVKRVYNFNPGPGVLPLEVLQEAQAELLDFKGTGMSVMEISHRSKEFEGVIQTAEADLRELLGIPSNYKVMFLQGGATLQFTMLPMNLRPAGASADYIVTGSWSKTAMKEAKKIGTARAAASTEADGFNGFPANLILTRKLRICISLPMRRFTAWNISVSRPRPRVCRWCVIRHPISSADRSMFQSMRCCMRVRRRMRVLRV
jgi:hypothetical protein